MRIVYVHTPMAMIPIPEREVFWSSFDRRYHQAHPDLRHMDGVLWELPHWMHWLGGVLDAWGYDDQVVVDFYTRGTGVEGIDSGVVRQALIDRPGDVYLFSPMTPNLHYAYEIAEVVKQLFPQAVTIFGGIVATPLRDQVAGHHAVDYVVYERGEQALPELLRVLESGGDVFGIGNLATKASDGTVVVTGERAYLPPSDLPFPRVDLFPESAGRSIRYIRLVYGLGCPYKCAFCTIQTIGRRPYYFPIERVLAELDAYRDRYGGHHHVYFGDETFTLDPVATGELCDAFAERGDIVFDCQTRLDRLDGPDLLPKLYRAGCRWLEMGLESLSAEAHSKFKQRSRLSPLRETLKAVRDEGIAVASFLVNGLPDQTPDQMRRSIDATVELIDDGLLQASYLFGLVPYPGSGFFARPESFGIRLKHTDFRLYHEELEPVYDTPTASSEEIYEVTRWGVTALGEAMSRPSYFGQMDEAPGYGSFWTAAHP